MYRERKTPYERDQDAKAIMLLVLAWLCLIFWAWGHAYISECPAIETWHFWLAFLLLWGPLSWFVVEFIRAERLTDAY